MCIIFNLTVFCPFLLFSFVVFFASSVVFLSFVYPVPLLFIVISYSLLLYYVCYIFVGTLDPQKLNTLNIFNST